MIGLLMIVLPVVVFILSLAPSHRFSASLGAVYRYLGGFFVLGGSALSVYVAMYSGDQGGIVAFYLQTAVILIYASLSILLLVVHWLFSASQSDSSAD